MDIVWPAFTLITEMVANVIEHGVFIASFEIWAMNLISCSRKKKRGSEIKLKAVGGAAVSKESGPNLS